MKDKEQVKPLKFTTMTTNVTISQVYMNTSIANFFFRKQAYKTLEDLIKRSNESLVETLNILDENTTDEDLDVIEEMFYSYGTEDIAETYDIELRG